MEHCVQCYGCVRSGKTNSEISHSENLTDQGRSSILNQKLYFFFEPTIFQMQHETRLKQVSKRGCLEKISHVEKPSLTMETVSTVIIVYCVVKSSQCKCYMKIGRKVTFQSLAYLDCFFRDDNP